jgi:hypothetical protein
MMFDVERRKLYEEVDRKGNANSTSLYNLCVCGAKRDFEID